jgi:hypothetical protein
MTRKILRTDLRGAYKQKFENIKAQQRFETDADTVRALIEHYDPSSNMIRIETELIGRIKEELENPRTRIKYGLFKVEDFIAQAIITYIEKIRSERGSLLDWDVRSQLSESQREVAIAFFELQTKHPIGLTRVEVANFLQRTEKSLEADLEYLVRAGLLEKRFHKQKIHIYYAP